MFKLQRKIVCMLFTYCCSLRRLLLLFLRELLKGDSIQGRMQVQPAKGESFWASHCKRASLELLLERYNKTVAVAVEAERRMIVIQKCLVKEKKERTKESFTLERAGWKQINFFFSFFLSLPVVNTASLLSKTFYRFFFTQHHEGNF